MKTSELVALYTTKQELVPLRYIESVREGTDGEQRVIDALADDGILILHTFSGREHTVKASDMKATIEDITNETLTGSEINNAIIAIWLDRVNKVPTKHPFL